VKYSRGMAFFKSPSFLTLTQLKKGNKKNGYYGSTERLKRIWECRKALFKEVRRRGYRIKAWCGVCEPPNHIHLVIDTPDFIPWEELSKIWHTITGDSYIIDIKRVKKDRQRLAGYLAKYLSKACSYSGFISSEDFDGQEHWDGWKPKPVPIRVNLEELKGFHLKGSSGLEPEDPRYLTCDECGFQGKTNKITGEEYGVMLYFYEHQYEVEIAQALDRICNIHHVGL